MIPESRPPVGAPEALKPEDWAKWPWERCSARVQHNPYGDGFWGRCDLVKGHDGDHALERGMMQPRWSTRWTSW